MGFSDRRLFNRETSVHDILGGGVVADVVLWRRKNDSLGLLSVTMASWLVFERSGYTLLSLSSSVLLLLLTILFLWAKSAALLNRPAPPLPELQLSEKTVNEVSELLRIHINKLLTVSQDVALGRNSRLYFKAAGCLCIISFISGLTDFPTLCYTCVLVFLSVPVLYERYEDYIDKNVIFTYRKLKELYAWFDIECIGRTRRWLLEKEKLS